MSIYHKIVKMLKVVKGTWNKSPRLVEDEPVKVRIPINIVKVGDVLVFLKVV